MMRSHSGDSSHITLAATLRCGETHFPTKRKLLFSMHSLLQYSACIVACTDEVGRATLTAARSAWHVPWSAWHVPRRPSGRRSCEMYHSTHRLPVNSRWKCNT